MNPDEMTESELAAIFPAYHKLRAMQRRFIDFYFGEAKGVKTDALRMAGYAHPEAHCSRITTQPIIKAAIDERAALLSVTRGEVLKRLSDIAMGGHTDYITVVSRYLTECESCGGIGGCEACASTGEICRFCRCASTECDGKKHGGASYARVDLIGLEAAGMMHLIKDVRTDKNGVQNIVFHDALKALPILGKFLQMDVKPAPEDKPLGEMTDEERRRRVAEIIERGRNRRGDEPAIPARAGGTGPSPDGLITH